MPVFFIFSHRYADFGRVDAHLEQIDREATEMVERLTSRMAKAEGVTESLKRSNQMAWIDAMTSSATARRKLC